MLAAMPTRIAEANGWDTKDLPPTNSAVECLAVDSCGSYLLPFLCKHVNGQWINAAHGNVLAVRIVGWRQN